MCFKYRQNISNFRRRQRKEKLTSFVTLISITSEDASASYGGATRDSFIWTNHTLGQRLELLNKYESILVTWLTRSALHQCTCEDEKCNREDNWALESLNPLPACAQSTSSCP
ncbi:uncharacterized protein LOC128201686 [Galleria mellonella]|uniref:Uncharacterized protein LOC128201686 n=1 Tax=Galleria mellonella TaxID=7137 RepID=A0ABM3MVG4_GALME|nr:uncharacterized protein LOC128201686 [Galleria mellonella]